MMSSEIFLKITKKDPIRVEFSLDLEEQHQIDKHHQKHQTTDNETRQHALTVLDIDSEGKD
jgi:hypothetical protein